MPILLFDFYLYKDYKDNHKMCRRIFGNSPIRNQQYPSQNIKIIVGYNDKIRKKEKNQSL